MPTGGRRSEPVVVLRQQYARSLRYAQRCRSEDRRSLQVPVWWRRRESNPRPKAFDNDVYMRIRVVAGTRARRRLSLFRPRGASTRRIAPQDLSLSLTGGSGGPPAKPAWSTSFPARQAWSGRTWLKQPVPDRCWRLCLFPPFTGDGPPTCSRCFMYLRRTQYAPSSCESGGNSGTENRPRIRMGTVAPHPGTASRIGYDSSSL